MEVKTVIFLFGAQASGKTTYLKKFFDFVETVSSDSYWTRNQEGKRIWHDAEGHQHDWGEEPIPADILAEARNFAKERLNLLLSINEPLIVFEGSLPESDRRKELISIIKDYDYRVVGYCLLPPLEECIRRNKERFDCVPQEVLRKTYDTFVLPSVNEGFDELFIIREVCDEEMSIMQRGNDS